MQELLQAEVRLFYNGRQDWDTEHFTARCATELYNKAKDIAKRHRAPHFNCGLATPEEEYKHSGPIRRPKVVAGPANPRDQVAAINAAMGLERGKS